MNYSVIIQYNCHAYCWGLPLLHISRIWTQLHHYIDVIMTTMASRITSLTIVYSTVYSDADQRKHQSSVSLAFVWGNHRDRWIPRTKGQLRGKCFHLMTSPCTGPVCSSWSMFLHMRENVLPFANKWVNLLTNGLLWFAGPVSFNKFWPQLAFVI